MSESQNIEYKSSWHEDYLDWICGFANAQGGKIYIGKNDSGNVVGVADYKDLTEKIPDKLERLGKKWDSVPVPTVRAEDLKSDTFTFFKEKGIKSGRIDADCRNDTPLQVLENLKFVNGDKLSRAAVMLFHPDPEKFVSGAYIKIGFFRTDSDLLFQDEIHGNLFEQVEKTMDLLLTKYTRALISYEGLTRVETYEYPKDALREALLNAVAHKDYSGPYPIQISVYADKIMIWNYGRLPENWTVEDLLDKHSSQPRNPDIATAFFRSGYVESWGRGMDKMRNLCVEAKIPAPRFSCKGNDFWAIFSNGIHGKFI
ncbi:MAG: putative DNA binding domain-containing protein [Prevotellaceae bacterium]|nr:putative DNA binding domain-containing protein [Prevotellaceae bacterium]